MKLVGVIWNSVYGHKEAIIYAIKKHCKIEKCFDIDLKYRLHKFINELYNYPSEEKWKSEIKYDGLKKYKNRTITVVVIDIVPGKKILNKRKNRMMFENVLALKDDIRDKFCYVIKNRKKQEIYREDCFHITDDEDEYNQQIEIVKLYEVQYKTGKKICR